MANQFPFQGGFGSQDSTQGPSGGYLLPPEQGEILVNGILVETGVLQLAGDARSTSARRTNFPIWLGQPNADFVGEGKAKPVTGAAFSQATINIKKIASMVLFTDEMIEDLMNGDLNVLVDAGVRQAISRRIESAGVGYSGNGAVQPFGLPAGDPALTTYAQYNLIGANLIGNPGNTTATAILLPGSGTVSGVDDELQVAVSSAMNVLETNGYGDPSDMGVLLGFGFQQKLRNARDAHGRPLYDGGTFAGQSIDALYGLQRAHSSALASATATCPITVGGVSGTASVGTTNSALVYVGAPVIHAGAVQGYVTAVSSAGVLTFSGGYTATTSDFVGLPKAVVLHRPNLHVRVRQDVQVTTSNQASIDTTVLAPGDTDTFSPSTVSLFQENLTAARYETRLGLLIHDAARAVVPIWG